MTFTSDHLKLMHSAAQSARMELEEAFKLDDEKHRKQANAMIRKDLAEFEARVNSPDDEFKHTNHEGTFENMLESLDAMEAHNAPERCRTHLEHAEEWIRKLAEMFQEYKKEM